MTTPERSNSTTVGDGGPHGREAAAERAEAVVLRVPAGELDPVLVPLLDELAAAAVEIAVIGLRSASSTADRLATSTTGPLLVVDAHRALLVEGPGAISPTGWRPAKNTFEVWWTERLWRAGIPPGAIDRIDGSVAGLAAQIERQLRFRAEAALPRTGSAPGWSIELGSSVGPGRARVRPSLLALSTGTTSTVGDLDTGPDAMPAFVLAAGAYGLGRDGVVRPLPGPTWTRLEHPDDQQPGSNDAGRWLLDLRAGILRHEPASTGTRSVRFMSLHRPGIGAIRAERPAPTTWPDPLDPPATPATLSAEHRVEDERRGDTASSATTNDQTTVAVAARQRVRVVGTRGRLERLSATCSGDATSSASAEAQLREAERVGFDHLLRDHRRAWGERWRHADIEIAGDDDAQLAIRFALFHLLSCAPTEGEAVVGARGLTGLAYAGHVFWDTDVFVLPALAATLPAAARAVLEYRVRRLGAARAEAARRGARGARFPWESADSGADVTPRSARDVNGRIVPILTGSNEEHINSDVAWAALHYVDWTGDEALFEGAGRGLVTGTADYWAGRVRVGADGRGHIDDVIGPDEYHAIVDDNVFTNLMVRWHLRQAARLVADDGEHTAEEFRTIADSLVDGRDPATGRHEQFSGFSALEPVLIDDVAPPPVAADLLLGRERVARTQIIKQADVVMAHHLIPDEFDDDSLDADLDFYLPRTAHGSSLSPAVYAAVLARAGRPDEAMPLFDLAARLDLDDLTRTTSGGLHLATMGGLWQAVVYGFGGIRPADGALHIDPHLPTRWTSLRVALRFRGDPVRVTITHDSVQVDADERVDVTVSARFRLRRASPGPPTETGSSS